MICGRFCSGHKKVTVIHVFASTNNADDEVREDLCVRLQETVNQCHPNDMTVIMVDFNANAGRGNRGRKRVMGHEKTMIMERDCVSLLHE